MPEYPAYAGTPLQVPSGGTAHQSLTPYALLAGGTNGTAPVQQVSGPGTPGQVLTSNGAGALPSFQAGGGGGGGGTPADGPAATYTFISGDIADPASWYGAVPVKILGTWTPTVSGTLALVPPSNNSDPDYTNFAYYLWKGTVANTDYPDATSGSSGFTGGSSVYVFGGAAPPAPSMFVVAGQSYKVIIVDYTGTAGGVIELDGLLNSLYPFSGISGPVTQVPPAMPTGWASVIGLLPDGSALCRRPVLLENQSVPKNNPTGNLAVSLGGGSATGSAAFAVSAGIASGENAHAEGTSTASGAQAHAEGGSTASGDNSHAEGYLTTASGFASHAEGGSCTAGADNSHAEGSSAITTRITESALGCGLLVTGKPFQTCRFAAGTQTANATPAPLLLDLGPGPAGISLTLTNNTLTLIKGWICAADTAGAVAKAWEVSALIDLASGTPRLVGSVTKTVLAADGGASTWDVTVTAAATDPVTVTGQASTTINWSAHLVLTEAPNP